jgi:[acyl-carrier-protein] S-malonyltransferase
MKIAAVFPGQGSQYVGMGKYLFDNFTSVKQLFEEASDAVKINLAKLCFEGPESDLTLTENTQPALVTVSVATFRCLQEETGWTPSYAAGHSVGEYSAVVAAGGMEFSHAVRAVRERGMAMQKAVPQGVGGMMAVMGATDDYVKNLCQWFTSRHPQKTVEPANFNSPGQVVISGHMECLEDLRENYKQAPVEPVPAKLRLIPLKVSAPFHCSLMDPAQETMRDVLEEMGFRQPKFPIVQNVVAEPVESAEWLKLNLVKQVTGSVRWTESVQKLSALGVNGFVEAGPGKVLTGLGKKILGDEGFDYFSSHDGEDFKATLADLQKRIKGEE